jgi:hypothetical protein
VLVLVVVLLLPALGGSPILLRLLGALLLLPRLHP